MPEFVDRYLHIPSIFIRYTMILDHPDLYSDSVTAVLQEKQRQALETRDYRVAQSLSEKLDLLRNCRKLGVENAFWGPGHTIDADLVRHAPDGYAAALDDIENHRPPRPVTERIEGLTRLLHRVNPNHFPFHRAELHQKLAAVHLAGRAVDPMEHTRKAVENCNSALEIYRRDIIPCEWARIQTYLAITLKNAGSDQGSEGIERAVHHYRQALTVYSPEVFGLNAAVTQMNLAIAMFQRTLGDPAENIDRAVSGFRRVLDVLTHDEFPLHWAATHVNLAAALRCRLTGDRHVHIREAIASLQQAESVFSQDNAPGEWAMIQTNLGNAWLDPALPDPDTAVKTAIDHYRRALDINTRDRFPLLWAKLSANLGIACSRPLRDSPAGNLDGTIRYCRDALSVFHQDSYPVEWAVTKKNLAIALINRQAEKGRIDAEEAARHLQDSLHVFTIDCFPRERLEALAQLSEIRFDQSRWEDALLLFEDIRQIDSVLRDQDVTGVCESRRVRVTGLVYSRAAYCLARCNRIVESLEWLEKGKMQMFRDRINRNRRMPEIMDPDVRDHYERLTNELRMLEAEQLGLAAKPRLLHRIADDIRAARSGMEEIISSFSADFPDSLFRETRFQDMCRCLSGDKTTAVAVFLVTKTGSLVILLTGSPDDPDTETISIDGFKYTDLENLVLQFMDWMIELDKFRDHPLPAPSELDQFIRDQQTDFDRLESRLDQIAQDLYIALFEQVVSRLEKKFIRELILVTHKELNILPVHLVHPPNETIPSFLTDRYTLRVTPAFGLQTTQQEPDSRNEFHSFLGITQSGVQPDLSCCEVSQIAIKFRDSKILPVSESTPESISRMNRIFDIVHFSCHGNFGMNDPYQSRLGADTNWTLPLILRDLRLPDTRLVILAACESGLVESRKLPDEMIGLPAGFLLAGAGSVMSSLWSIPDRSARAFMDNFYYNLIDLRMSPPEALKGARMTVRKIPDHRAMICWGAFVMIG